MRTNRTAVAPRAAIDRSRPPMQVTGHVHGAFPPADAHRPRSQPANDIGIEGSIQAFHLVHIQLLEEDRVVDRQAASAGATACFTCGTACTIWTAGRLASADWTRPTMIVTRRMSPALEPHNHTRTRREIHDHGMPQPSIHRQRCIHVYLRKNVGMFVSQEPWFVQNAVAKPSRSTDSCAIRASRARNARR